MLISGVCDCEVFFEQHGSFEYHKLFLKIAVLYFRQDGRIKQYAIFSLTLATIYKYTCDRDYQLPATIYVLWALHFFYMDKYMDA